MIAILLTWMSILAGGCPALFAGGKAPMFNNRSVAAANDATICFQTFAVYHSEKTRTPLWAAEHLTRSAMHQAEKMRREGNEFREEESVGAHYRAWLRDYVRSGFDRGHMAPSGNQPDLETQRNTFTLANVVPQNPKLNRGLWADYEASIRQIAIQRGEIYVITGVLYEGSQVQRIGGRVIVPTSIYKAVLDPASGDAGAVICENSGFEKCVQITLSELQERAGLTIFPGFSVRGDGRLEIELIPKRHRRNR